MFLLLPVLFWLYVGGYWMKDLRIGSLSFLIQNCVGFNWEISPQSFFFPFSDLGEIHNVIYYMFDAKNWWKIRMWILGAIACMWCFFFWCDKKWELASSEFNNEISEVQLWLRYKLQVCRVDMGSSIESVFVKKYTERAH